MKNAKLAVSFLLFSIFTLFSCSPKKLESRDFEITKADGEKVSINAEIADTYGEEVDS